MAANPEQKRGLGEQAVDVGFSAVSVATLPVWVLRGIGSVATANFLMAGVFAALAYSDVVTIRETFKAEKSAWNPSYWFDKIRGRKRLGGNQRLA